MGAWEWFDSMECEEDEKAAALAAKIQSLIRNWENENHRKYDLPSGEEDDNIWELIAVQQRALCLLLVELIGCYQGDDARRHEFGNLLAEIGEMRARWPLQSWLAGREPH